MKTSILITLIICTCNIQSSLAQIFPAKFNYQVSIRDANGDPISDRPVSFRISILENPNAPSSFSYREEHKNKQTKFGTSSLVIGDGINKNTTIEMLPFQTKSYHLRVEIDENNGTQYKDLITTQLISVPYAMVASQLGQNNATTGQVLKWNGVKWTPGADSTSSNSGASDLKGDVTGTPANNKVEKIHNRKIASTPPTNGQILKWNSVLGQWSYSIDSIGYWNLINNNLLNSNTNGSVYVGLANAPSSTAALGVKNILRVYNSNGDRIITLRPDNSDYGGLYVESPNNITNQSNFVGFDKNNIRPLMGVANGNTIYGGIRFTDNDMKTEVYASVKNFIQPHPNNSDKLISYACIEGPEAAAYERGTVKMINGKAEVKFSDHFGLLINPNTMTVIVTPLSKNSKGLAVTSKSINGLVIEELNNGSGIYEIDWEVKAVRKGYEDFQVIRDKKEYSISNSFEN